MERDAAPCREDLADRGAQVVRHLDALPHVTDHGFALNGYLERSQFGETAHNSSPKSPARSRNRFRSSMERSMGAA